MLRLAALAIAFFVLTACGAREPVASVYPDATSVRMFVRSDEPIGDPPSYEGRWLNPEGGYRLTAAQVQRLRATIHAEPIPVALTACFVPHHFFRFYDGTGRQVGELAVCFCCAGVRADPGLRLKGDQQLTGDYEALEKLVVELGSSTKVDCGEDG